MKDNVTNNLSIRKNDKLELFFQKPNIFETIRNNRLQWAGHAWRNQNPLLRTALEKNSTEKWPIGRPRMRREDVVKNDVEELGGGSDWKARATKPGCIWSGIDRNNGQNIKKKIK